MLSVQDRISALIGRLEAGESITPEELDRVYQLQALDLARIGQQFAEECCRREDEQTQLLQTLLESDDES